MDCAGSPGRSAAVRSAIVLPEDSYLGSGSIQGSCDRAPGLRSICSRSASRLGNRVPKAVRMYEMTLSATFVYAPKGSITPAPDHDRKLCFRHLVPTCP